MRVGRRDTVWRCGKRGAVRGVGEDGRSYSVDLTGTYKVDTWGMVPPYASGVEAKMFSLQLPVQYAKDRSTQT